MNKEENTKFLKIQTCVLKVNIHCDGCKKKVKKLLHKIDGVYTTSIDAEQGKVTVSGNVDPAALIKKLCKAGKHAELWAPKGGHNLSNQFQKLQLESKKGQQQDRGKTQKGGGGGGGKDQKNQQPPPNQQQLLQQMKEFQDLKLRQVKDLKFPFQDFKSVKFSSPPDGCDDGTDYDDEFDDDYDDEEFDDMDGFDDDFDEDLKPIKMKPMNPPYNGNGMMNDKKGFGGGGANGKKSGTAAAVDIPVQIKGMVGNNNAKNVDSKGKKGGGGGSGNQNQGGGKNGGRAQDGKKGDNGNTGAKNASGGNNNNTNRGNVGSKTEGGTSAVGGGQTMLNPNVPNMMLGQGFPAMGMGQMGNIQAPMGNIPAPRGAVQGLPAGGPPPGYFQGGVVPPEMRAVANPYQQQYMAALMQQQRMMNGFDRPYQTMGYARPPPPHVSYMPPPPPPGEPYTHFFSDENTNSCSIM